MADNPILDYSDTVVYERDRLPFGGTDGALTRAAESVVGAVGEAATSNLQGELGEATDQFVAEAQAAEMALEGPLEDDVIAKAIGTDEADVSAADRAVRPVLEQLARLRLAEEQGAIDATEVRIRHEDILRRAVARMPAYASDLIQAAGEALGYNPVGSQLDALESELRSRGAGGSGPKNEIEEYYDKQADSLGIDRTQKWSDPVGYYTKVHREISLNEAAQQNVRTLGMLSTTRQINEEQAFDLFRTNVVPSLYNRFVGRLVSQAQEFQRQSAAGMAGSIESGALRAFQSEIVRAKQGIQEAIQASPMGNYLTSERIQQATNGMNTLLDEAAKATDPTTALSLVKQVLEAQTLSQVDLKNPGIGALRALFADIGRLPSGSLIAQNVEASVADASVMALMQAYGGVVNSTGGYPVSVVPPLPGLKTPDRLRAEEQAAAFMNELAAEKKLDPETARATVRGLGIYGAQYQNQKKGSGQAPPRAEARKWLTAMSKESWLNNVSQPGVPTMEVVNSLAPYTEMVADEAIDIGYDIQDVLAQENVRFTRPMSNPSGRRGLERNRRIPGSATVGELVSLEWQDGKVVVVPRPDFNPNITISKDSLNKAVAKVQAVVSTNATLIVKASAHQRAAMEGSQPQYEMVTQAIGEMILSIPMEDIDNAGG